MTQFKKLNLIMGNWDAMSPKKNSRPMKSKKKNSNLKIPKVGIQKKKRIKTANKTSNAIRGFIHDTSCEFLIRHVTGMKRHVTIKK